MNKKGVIDKAMTKEEDYISLVQEKEAIFDERTAIRIAMQEMKEQTRMDYDLYLESRRIRNEQIAVMLDRLRDLDHRDEIVELKYKRALSTAKQLESPVIESPVIESPVIESLTIRGNSTQKVEPKNKIEDKATEDKSKLQKRKDYRAERKKKEVKETVTTRIKEEKLKNTPRGNVRRVPIERIEPIIISYLTEHGETSIRFIKQYVEEKVNFKWANFGDPISRVMERNPRVKKGSKKGYYYIEKKE